MPKQPVITSAFRLWLFFLLRNDRVWAMLTEEERANLLEANREHNTFREDYFDPTKYGGGQGVGSEDDRRTIPAGAWLGEFLDRYQPRRVIEVGPGAGYFTRMLIEHPSVEELDAIDINPYFLEHISEYLSESGPSRLRFSSYCGDFQDVEIEPADAVILMNALHHIPNREDFFDFLEKRVRPGGFVFFFDPSHYLPRVRQLIGKLLSPGYVRGKTSGEWPTGTHHFCTLGEFRRLVRRSGKFRLISHRYDAAWRFLPVRVLNRLARVLGVPEDHYLRRTALQRLLSQKIMVVLERI